MASFAQNVVGSGVPNHYWADNMMNLAVPNAGDNGLGYCGTLGGTCSLNIEYAILSLIRSMRPIPL